MGDATGDRSCDGVTGSEMELTDLYTLRETYNEQNILLCFNGPFSQGLIEEIGNALRKHMQSEPQTSSAAMDVFGVYIEITQNIRQYATVRQYSDTDASATVIISRDDEGRYVVAAGNIVEASDGEALVQRIESLATLDKAQLKAAYKEQLRKPREDGSDNGGLGLIDIARRASAPVACSLRPAHSDGQKFFSLRVVI
jgi:hypothetical protein